MDEMQRIVLESKRFSFWGKYENLYTCWPPLSAIFPMKEPFCEKLLHDALHQPTCWKDLDVGNISRLFSKYSKLIIQINHTIKRFLAFFAYHVCVTRNQTQQMTFLYDFLSVWPKVDSDFIAWNAANCLWKIRFFFRKKSDNFYILALSVHEVCNAMRHSRNIVCEQFSVLQKMIKTFIYGLKKVVQKISESGYQNGFTIMQFWTIFSHQVACFRNQTQYWTVEQIFTEKTLSTETWIEELSPEKLVNFRFEIREN